ncbi:neocarzinostatin apoprotein domain-containing protein [Nocardia sp. NPDC056000]|uniref:neocarzinostatin apoprotein domain-containing protein n=1 Tax=Nocardia sp. NPDC056000 TaxID=3345674 RepID=UPI0035DDD0C1
MIRTIAPCLLIVAAALPLGIAPGHAAPDAGAAIEVSASADLTEGQRITVNGSGFRAGLAAVAVGLCKQGFTNGLKDCDLEGGATFVNISGDGTLPTVTLTARPRFHDIDCTRRQCVIAAAPLPGAEPQAVIAANSAEVAIGFAGSPTPAPTSVPKVAAVRTESDTNGPSTLLWGVTAALMLIVAVLALADRRRL